MIRVLTGENSFEAERALARVLAGFKGEVRRVSADSLKIQDMPELLAGVTLFSDARTVVIRRLSENSAAWNWLGENLGRLDDDTTLILFEPKLDKRTKTYKALAARADIQEFSPFGPRDEARLEHWVIEEAAAQGLKVDPRAAHLLVERVGSDQWELQSAVEKLSIVGSAALDEIKRVTDARQAENVFLLFETALRKESNKLAGMVSVISVSEDPYRLFGLLSGQVFQLAALIVSEKPSAAVAKDIGVHPYALSKLAPYARRFNRTKAGELMAAFAEADYRMKTASVDPWLLIERALVKVSRT